MSTFLFSYDNYLMFILFPVIKGSACQQAPMPGAGERGRGGGNFILVKYVYSPSQYGKNKKVDNIRIYVYAQLCKRRFT